MMALNYTIDREKLAKVVSTFNRETDPAATDELVETEICRDWNEGAAHQEWIDNASPEEIAVWLARFY